MPRQRSIFGIFHENLDLNQGPNFNASGMNESDECNSRSSPTERRLLSNDLSGELNFSFVNAGHHPSSRSFSSWDVGESSSRENLQDQVANDGLKLDNNWSNSQLLDGPSNMQSSDSIRMPMDVDLNVDYRAKSGNPEMEASSSGTSDECGADFSFCLWGPSSKRKVLEGTTGEIFGSGSSSCFPEAENIAWHTPNRNNNGSSSLSASSPLVSSQTPLNTIAESSRRYNGMRDSGPSSITSTGYPGSYPNSNSSHQSARYLELTSRGPIPTSANSSLLSLQLPLVNALPFPGSGSSLPQDNGSEANFGSLIRNNEQHRYFAPSNETRSSVQDPNNWSLGMGTNGGNPLSSSHNDVGSGSHPSNALWTPRLNPTTQSQQRLSDFSPWTLFPSSEADSVSHRSRFPFLPSGSSSTSEENVLSSGVNSHGRTHQPLLRPAPLMEAPGDEWQVFGADIHERHTLVAEMRQILSALRRGENLRAEDFMLFDPFISGVADLNDRHRDMRLDVDNMSYEELLALEERIGDVKTGLSEEVILKSMKQRKHVTLMGISTQNFEPCCICREEYENGDEIGSLDCGHDFHTCCIKQWLSQKNLCPICKMTGISI